MIKISYAILACDEHEELNKLLDLLYNNIDIDSDEIVIVLDEHNTTDKVRTVIENYVVKYEPHYINLHVYEHSLNKDFATQKNFLNSKCTCDYIIQLDADELVTDFFIKTIRDVLTLNPSVDLYRVPRINIVRDITPKHVQMWNWRLNEKGYVNFPDLQTRIYKNKPEIKWYGKVHEQIIGYDTYSQLPFGDEWCILHKKDIKKQEKQNEFYSKIN